MKDTELLLCLLGTLMIPFATAGNALIQQGLGRSRSAAHAMLATFCVCGISAIAFLALGQGWAGMAGQGFRVAHLGGIDWNWLGNAPLVLQHFPSDDVARAATLCFHLFAVGFAASIALGAGSDRWRLAAICACAAVFATIEYPLFAHWTWGGGWLASLTSLVGVSSFVDIGGAGTTQVTGGVLALSVAWILGPRRGKYFGDGMAAAIPAHNIVLVLFGCSLALVGWIGMDTAAAVLFDHAGLQAVPGIMVNALLAAAAGGLASVMGTPRSGSP